MLEEVTVHVTRVLPTNRADYAPSSALIVAASEGPAQ